MRKQTRRARADGPAPVDGELGSRARDWLRSVQRETDAHPFRAAGIAAGAGFILGGGLFSPLTGRALSAGLRLAIRIAIVPTLSRGLGVMGARLLESTEPYASTTTMGQGEKS